MASSVSPFKLLQQVSRPLVMFPISSLEARFPPSCLTERTGHSTGANCVSDQLKSASVSFVHNVAPFPQVQPCG